MDLVILDFRWLTLEAYGLIFFFIVFGFLAGLLTIINNYDKYIEGVFAKNKWCSGSKEINLVQ